MTGSDAGNLFPKKPEQKLSKSLITGSIIFHLYL